MASISRRDVESWEKDKARFVSGEWTKNTLVAVAIWRAWNNIDIATRVRGEQKETWRMIVARFKKDGGLDRIDRGVAHAVLNWLSDHGYKHQKDRDTGGPQEERIEFWGTTIRLEPPLPQIQLSMPPVLARSKTKQRVPA
jgi:hypothetical protein